MTDSRDTLKTMIETDAAALHAIADELGIDRRKLDKSGLPDAEWDRLLGLPGADERAAEKAAMSEDERLAALATANHRNLKTIEDAVTGRRSGKRTAKVGALGRVDTSHSSSLRDVFMPRRGD